MYMSIPELMKSLPSLHFTQLSRDTVCRTGQQRNLCPRGHIEVLECQLEHVSKMSVNSAAGQLMNSYILVYEDKERQRSLFRVPKHMCVYAVCS
jgi:hypothetical protein